MKPSAALKVRCCKALGIEPLEADLLKCLKKEQEADMTIYRVVPSAKLRRYFRDHQPDRRHNGVPFRRIPR